MSDLQMITLELDELKTKSISDLIEQFPDVFFSYTPGDELAYMGFQDIDEMTYFCDYLYDLKSDIAHLEYCYNM